jgi:hypothetical protein
MTNNLGMKAYLIACAVYALILLNIGCQTAPISQENAPPLIDQPQTQARVALSWETKPERKAWSDSLISRMNAEWALYDAAKDIGTFCPKYGALPKATRQKAWGEIWVGLAYYESSWNPKSSSVDVGTQGDKGSWSVGLYQVSRNDQPWAGGGTKYTYDELLTPLPNIHLATVLMKRQLKNTATIALPNSSKFRYWAILLVGNKYQKISEIAARVQKNVPDCK